MLEQEKLDELDIALLRQMEREILLDTVYDERRLSEAELKVLLKDRSVRALGKIRRILDEDTADEDCFRGSRPSSKSAKPSAQTAARGTIFKYLYHPRRGLPRFCAGIFYLSSDRRRV